MKNSFLTVFGVIALVFSLGFLLVICMVVMTPADRQVVTLDTASLWNYVLVLAINGWGAVIYNKKCDHARSEKKEKES